jgi:hypothetical protein
MESNQRSSQNLRFRPLSKTQANHAKECLKYPSGIEYLSELYLITTIKYLLLRIFQTISPVPYEHGAAFADLRCVFDSRPRRPAVLTSPRTRTEQRVTQSFISLFDAVLSKPF